uniref:Villin-1 n=1 Tax=Oncorhynchus mykiss TaxID=8022 RepID=A0A8C7Q9X8_ONCMY
MPQIEVKTQVAKVLNKTTPGLQIWRIEALEMVPFPSKAYGNFYEGDSYIILYVSNQCNVMISFTYDIHFWLGKDTSNDEQGAAAIYTTMMDEHLGGVAVQHREAQGYESDTFRGYFKQGIIYKKGGVASGMKQVETNTYNIRRLLHVKGKKHVVAGEVDMSWSSFNKGDVFLLDLGNLIIQWNGPKSNRMEKLKGMTLAKDIRDRERGGRAQVSVVEGDDEKSSEEAMKLMKQHLGETRRDIRDCIAPDDIVDQKLKSSVKLFHISDAQGNLVVQEVAVKPLTQDLLNHEDCFLLDQGGTRIFIWKGKKASKTERSESLDKAEVSRAKGYPISTYIEMVNDGAESAVFKQLFQRWTVKGQTVGMGTTSSTGKIAKVEQIKFDATSMHARPDLAAQQKMVDDGTGEAEVWRLEDSELVPVDRKWLGHFYGGDCYLILYKYEVSNRSHYMLYMWQGRHATTGELAASAFQAVNIDRQYNGEPVQVRVPMGKEPLHLMAIFKGKMVVYEVINSKHVQPAVRLFHIHGTNEFNTRAIEVPARSSSLNSNDVFVLSTDTCCYLWYGKGCSGDEREMGKSLADIISRREKQVIAEGQEPAHFWVNLGGKSQYADRPCSSEFTNQIEKDNVVPTAQEYLKSHPGGRDVDTPIVMIKQGFEPPTFTGWFHAWDPHMWSGGKSYQELKAELGDATDIIQITVVSLLSLKTTSNSTQNNSKNTGIPLLQPTVQATFPADKLLNCQTEDLPEGVDPTKKEEHLSNDDFALILGVSRAEFYSMPNWKQQNMKKEKGLF